MKKTVLILNFIITGFILSGNNISGFYKKIAENNNDTTKLNLWIQLGDAYSELNHDSSLVCYLIADKICDSLISNLNNNSKTVYLKIKASACVSAGISYYYKSNYPKAENYYLAAVKIYTELPDNIALAKTYNNLGVLYRDMGTFVPALHYFNRSLELKQKNKDEKGIAQTYNNLGTVYDDKGIYDKANENYIKALKIYESLNDQKGISQCYNNIGSILASQKNYTEAETYFKKSLEIDEKSKDYRGLLTDYNNLGIINYESGKFNLSLENFNKCLAIAHFNNDTNNYALIYNNIGNIYIKTNEFNNALDYYIKALNIKEFINDKTGIARALGNIANTYLKMGNFPDAVKNSQKSLELAIKSELISIQKDNYLTLSQAYEQNGDINKSLENFKNYINLNDSLLSLRMNREITEIQSNYTSEKKLLEIEKLTKENEIKNTKIIQQKEDIDRKKTLIFSIISVLIIIIVLAVLLYIQFRKRKLLNSNLSEQNKAIIQQNEEIETQKDLIVGQKKTVEDQKRQIEQLHFDTKDSIRYARHIQNAVISPENSIFSSYIIHLPAEIVSGCLLWEQKIDSKILICLIDNNTTGVTGALSVMLNAATLKEIQNSVININAERFYNLFMDSISKKGANNKNISAGVLIIQQQEHRFYIDYFGHEAEAFTIENFSRILNTGSPIEIKNNRQILIANKPAVEIITENNENNSNILQALSKIDYTNQKTLVQKSINQMLNEQPQLGKKDIIIAGIKLQ